MATIKFKKGTGTPAGLTLAEPAFDATSNLLYVGITGGSKWIGAEIDNGTLATNSSIKVPTQFAVKTYVDANIAGGAVSQLNGLTGNVFIGAGPGLILAAAGKGITLTNAGVTSINGLTGAVTSVAFTNTANTFTLGNVFNAGVTTSDLTVTSAATVGGNLSVTGNLTVNGTTTYVNSTVTEIADPIITLGWTGGVGGMPSDDNKDRGIAFKYNSSGGKTGFFGYDDSTGYFTFVPNATITSEVVSGSLGTIQIGTVLGSNTGNSLNLVASPEITSVDDMLTISAASRNSRLVLKETVSGFTGAIIAASFTGRQTATLPDHSGTLVVPTNLGTLDYILKATSSTGQPTWINPNAAGFTAYAAQEVVGGAAGNLLYQSAANVTSFVTNAGITGSVLTYNTTTNVPTFANPNTLGFTAYGSTVAVNVQGGAAGNMVYQTAANTSSFVANSGVTGYFLTYNTTTNTPTWANPNTAGFTAYGSTIAVNIQGGANGSLVYQTGANASTTLPIGTSGFVLTSSGTLPQWSSGTGITVGTAQTVTVASDVSDTTCFLAYINTASDSNQAIKYNSSLSYNATTNFLEANIDGGAY